MGRGSWFSAALHPPDALSWRAYSCGRAFQLDVLQAMQAAGAPGVVALVSGEGMQLFNTTARPGATATAQLAAKMQARLGNRHARGGQSAPRFQRLNDEAHQAWVVRVRECMTAATRDGRPMTVVAPADWLARLRSSAPRLPSNATLVCRAWHESEARDLARAHAPGQTPDLACASDIAQALGMVGTLFNEDALAALARGELSRLFLPVDAGESGACTTGKTHVRRTNALPPGCTALGILWPQFVGSDDNPQ